MADRTGPFDIVFIATLTRCVKVAPMGTSVGPDAATWAAPIRINRRATPEIHRHISSKTLYQDSTVCPIGIGQRSGLAL